uniref:protein-serine/threonine phosphatase n=1 Tax=Anopheles coluzzii TaxID=1518534 RepID=A0A8W7PAZ8_ANOCL
MMFATISTYLDSRIDKDDKKSARDEETQSKVIRGRSGCPKFSTSQGTIALMLGSGEHLRASCEDQLTATSITAAAVDPAADNADNGGSSSRSSSAANDDAPAASNGADGGGIGMADTGEGKVEGRAPSRPASSCSSGSSSSSSDIQQHLQSMTCLLRPEETLKMAVKLESLRTGRTRYLVVVSRTVTSKRHSTAGTTPYHGASGGTSSSIGSNAASSSTLQMVAAAAAPPATYATVASQQFGRVSSTVPSGQQQQHLRHSGSSSSSSETFNGSDTYVSSLDNCVLSVGCSAGGGRLPPTGGNAAPTCRSDQCDSKANSRLISSTVSVDAVTSPDYVGAPFASPSGGVDDATTLGGDRRSCAIDSTCLYEPGEQQLHPASSSTSAIPVEGGKKLEESCLLGIDCNERTTVGLVLKVLADTSIRLDGDGGFSVSSCGKQHIFKPVSVQAMWSALQTLHKASFKAREHNFFAGGPSHDWVAYYEAHIDSDRSCLNEWNAMDSLESRRPPPTEREETESVIRSKLKEVMMSVDLDDVTSKFIRGRLEELLDMDLGEYKPFIDAEMLVILGQMDAPTEIFDHVYLGSEWNASNLEELQRNGVHHILNVTREIDNFFPGLFHYCNVRVYDDEKTDLLRHWDNTFKFISRAKMEGSKVLVHCKMGISRSASVVIAYAMKANGWDFGQALQHVKEKRSCIKPNKNFLMQLETYQGMLDAMKNKEKLQRSKSETNLKLTGAKEGRSLPGSEPTPLIQALNGASGGGSGGGKKHTSFPIVHALGKEAVAVAEKAAPAPEEDPSADGVDEGDAGPCRGRTRTRQLKVGASGQLPDHRQGEPTSHPVPLGAAALASSSSPPGPASTAKAAAKCLANLYLPQGPYKPWSACDGRICTRAAGALKRHKSLSPESLNPRWPDGAEFAGSSLAKISPGTRVTVKRTKKRIEERGSNAAAATSSSSTLKWTGPASEKVPAPVGHEPAHNLPSADPLHLPTNRARQGMVSSSYARLSASAPDSYNMYAGSRAGSTSGPALDPAQAAKRQTKLNQQHSFAAAVNLLARTGEPGAAAPYCLRVNVRGSTANRQPQKPEEAADEEDAFSAGKVRNLKMNFEAKSNDRRTGQKKVRSLPSSPVAVHVSMGGQVKQQQHQPIATAATPPSTVAASSPAKPLPEDVTVRDLVDRYEVHGPRMRPTGSNSLSRTQRPRSVFEPLKQGGKACVQAPGPLTHSTSQLRLDETMRPPVPPIVRGLVIPAHGAGGANTAHCSNNNSSSTTTTGNSHTYIGAGPSISATSNARNKNNNNARSAASQQGAGGSAVEGRGVALSTVGGGKRMQQHGRTHPLAKISPGARHHHHHHIVHHHYTVGPLQQHRHMGAAPGPPVSGTTGPAATTVTANAYNTM